MQRADDDQPGCQKHERAWLRNNRRVRLSDIVNADDDIHARRFAPCHGVGRQRRAAGHEDLGQRRWWYWRPPHKAGGGTMANPPPEATRGAPRHCEQIRLSVFFAGIEQFEVERERRPPADPDV